MQLHGHQRDMAVKRLRLKVVHFFLSFSAREGGIREALLNCMVCHCQVLFDNETTQSIKREFSEEAKAVFDAGRELWKYYHSKPNVNVNASLYDIREYFQGRNDKGRMNSKSDDETYMELIGELRNKLNFLADKIKPKIYEYEFLKE